MIGIAEIERMQCPHTYAGTGFPVAARFHA
jgi:hypothetical protein